MKAVVRIEQKTSRPARNLYLRTLLVAAVCEFMAVWVFWDKAPDSKSQIAKIGDSVPFIVVGSLFVSVLVLWVGLRWMTTAGLLANLYSRRRKGYWCIGTLLGHIRGRVLRVQLGDRPTLKSVAQAHRRDTRGNQVGFLWTLTNGEEKVRCDVDAPVTDEERQQLQRWLESLSQP